MDPEAIPLIATTFPDRKNRDFAFRVWVARDLVVWLDQRIAADDGRVGTPTRVGTWDPARLCLAPNYDITREEVLGEVLVELVRASGERVTPLVCAAHLALVKSAQADGGMEMPHVFDDAMRQVFIAAVARGACDDVANCAAIVASSADLPFPRYYV